MAIQDRLRCHHIPLPNNDNHDNPYLHNKTTQTSAFSSMDKIRNACGIRPGEAKTRGAGETMVTGDFNPRPLTDKRLQDFGVRFCGEPGKNHDKILSELKMIDSKRQSNSDGPALLTQALREQIPLPNNDNHDNRSQQPLLGVICNYIPPILFENGTEAFAMPVF